MRTLRASIGTKSSFVRVSVLVSRKPLDASDIQTPVRLRAAATHKEIHPLFQPAGRGVCPVCREKRRKRPDQLALADNANAANGERRFHGCFIAAGAVAVKPQLARPAFPATASINA
jgi:hypothetical protein